MFPSHDRKDEEDTITFKGQLIRVRYLGEGDTIQDGDLYHSTGDGWEDGSHMGTMQLSPAFAASWVRPIVE